MQRFLVTFSTLRGNAATGIRHNAMRADFYSLASRQKSTARAGTLRRPPVWGSTVSCVSLSACESPWHAACSFLAIQRACEAAISGAEHEPTRLPNFMARLLFRSPPPSSTGHFPLRTQPLRTLLPSVAASLHPAVLSHARQTTARAG